MFCLVFKNCVHLPWYKLYTRTRPPTKTYVTNLDALFARDDLYCLYVTLYFHVFISGMSLYAVIMAIFPCLLWYMCVLYAVVDNSW